MAFVNAEETCRSFDGHLVSISDAFTNGFLMDQASSFLALSSENQYWIGASTIFVPGTWTWTDSTQFGYTNWAKGQPESNISSCGAQNVLSSLWFSSSCSTAKTFMCKVPPASTCQQSTCPTPKQCSPSCPTGWTYYGPTNKCFMKIHNVSFADALNKCETYSGKYNGTLASIHSDDENEFINSIFENSRL
uniref:C-type lectin domain-containing protein n=1 Tax=Acrobeloides nanus TaxID=290746 RepID=A0A914DWB2_9BILA